jgi:hypothetical protein
VTERRGAYRALCENLRENDDFEDLGINGMTILKQLLKQWDRTAWTGFMLLRIGTSGGLS